MGVYILTGGSISPASLKRREEDLPTANLEQWPYNIGEHVYNLSKEYKEKHGDIQWSLIAGVRHRLVHDYDGTNWNIIAKIIFDEIPVLLKQLEKIMGSK